MRRRSRDPPPVPAAPRTPSFCRKPDRPPNLASIDKSPDVHGPRIESAFKSARSPAFAVIASVFPWPSHVTVSVARRDQRPQRAPHWPDRPANLASIEKSPENKDRLQCPCSCLYLFVRVLPWPSPVTVSVARRDQRPQRAPHWPDRPANLASTDKSLGRTRTKNQDPPSRAPVPLPFSVLQCFSVALARDSVSRPTSHRFQRAWRCLCRVRQCSSVALPRDSVCRPT